VAIGTVGGAMEPRLTGTAGATSGHAPVSVRLVSGYALLSAVFGARLLARPLAQGGFDRDVHSFYYAAVIKSIFEYGQPPFWNPWYCGGNVLWQNPQVALLSPVYVLAAVMPLAAAIKVGIVLHVWMALVGMHLLLTRVAGLTFLPGVVYVASLFAFCGAGALHLAVGHGNFLTLFYLPVLFYFVIRAITNPGVRWCCAAAAILALILLNGGLHMMPTVALGIGVLACGVAWSRRSVRPLLMAAAIVLIGLAYAAPKLGPMAALLRSPQFWDTRAMVPHPDRMTILMMVRAYAGRMQEVTWHMSEVQQAGWWEYGNYVGELGILLLVGATAWTLVRPGLRAPWVRPAALAALVFLIVSAGEFSELAPATWLARAPLFSSFRLNSRFTIGFVLFAALALAAAARVFATRIRWTPGVRLLATLLCCAGVGDLVLENGRVLSESFAVAPLATTFSIGGGPSTAPQDAQTGPSTADSPMLRAIMMNRATLDCYEPLQLVRRAEANRPLVWAEPPADVRGITFTPNRIQAGVLDPAGERGRIYFNQNVVEGWTSTAGPLLLEPGPHGRAYVELAPGQTGRLSFTFRPPWLIVSLGVFLVAIVFTVVAIRRR
jgi:hypothetical protein